MSSSPFDAFQPDLGDDPPEIELDPLLSAEQFDRLMGMTTTELAALTECPQCGGRLQRIPDDGANVHIACPHCDFEIAGYLPGEF